MGGRYFEGTHPKLSARLDEHFERLRERWTEVAEKSTALVLGGGYGRGEGGVTDDGRLYNDLDYFHFTDAPDDPELAAWCARVEREETEALGVDVEIKRLRAGEVAAGLETMMFADVVAGHVAVAGDAGFLTRLSPDFTRIGAAEATRLLWNRGSGLYFARCSEDGGFIERNHAKLKLALGDAWLCLEGTYVPKCRERGRRLAEMKWPAGLEVLGPWHAEAVEWKFKPSGGSRPLEVLREESDELAGMWEKMWLRVESKRLGRELPDLSAYLDVRRIFPEEPAWRNLLLAVRDRMKRGGFLRPVRDYPRGALMRALPCLLELGGRREIDAARYLPKVTEKEYERWWHHYS